MEFIFTTERSVMKADEIVAFIGGPRWGIGTEDYPDYVQWLEKVHRQLKKEDKRAIIALVRGGVVGVVLYQVHKDFEAMLELKNITVRPDQYGRYVASFLLRNAEVEGRRDFGISGIMIDTKAANLTMRSFLTCNGYSEIGAFDIYGKGGGDDVLLHKTLQ